MRKIITKLLLTLPLFLSGCNQKPQCINITESDGAIIEQMTTAKSFKKINSDTLEFKEYNHPENIVDFESDFLPAYASEFDVEITDIRYSAGKRHLEHGMNRNIKYSFSFKEPTHIDSKGGKWYDTWCIESYSFDSTFQAVNAFNNYLKGANDYDEAGLVNKGNDSRRLLLSKKIFLISGSCRTTWFVENAKARLLKLYLGEKKPDPRTIITTWCGAGSSY